MNPHAEQLYGWNAQDALGRAVSEVCVFEGFDGKAAAAEWAARAKKRWAGELLVQRRDGTSFLASVVQTPVCDSSGSPCWVMAVSSDITDTRCAATELSESEERFRAAAEGSLDALFILTCERDKAGAVTDFVFTDLNARAEQQLGIPRAEVIGRSVLKVPPMNRMGGFFDKCVQVYETGRVLDEDYAVPSAKGPPSWWHHQVIPLADGVAISNRDITEKKLGEERIATQLQHVAALRAIDYAIAGSLDMRLTLNVVTEQALIQLGADAIAILLLAPNSLALTYAAGRGFRTRAIEQSRLLLGEGLASKAVLERQLVHVHNPPRSLELARAPLLETEGFVEYYAAPLTAKGEVVGVMEVFHRAAFTADEAWRTFLETLAGQTAVAVDSARLFEDLQRSNMDLSLAYDATIEGWSRALDLRDKETEGHTQRVTEMTERVARAMGIGEPEIAHMRRGALLHDIGKMGVPDTILFKPAALTDDEWLVMRQHPQFAFAMLAPIDFLRPALDIPYCHHEKWDGTGYPRGLKGEQIPLAARLFAVIDVWDALSSDRPYRKAWSETKVTKHIKSQSGTAFDPRAVDVFLQVIDEMAGERAPELWDSVRTAPVVQR